MKVCKKFLWILSLIVTMLFTGSLAACGDILGSMNSSEEPVGIIAEYEQSTEVFEDTPLNDLRADLTVWLEMADETVAKIDDYTLSGTLAVGESEVTVTYDLVPTLTATFNVVVSEGHTHVFTNYVSDNNATCEVDGTKTAICDDDSCEMTDTVTDEGTALSHAFTNYVSDNNATCKKDGTKTAECDNECGATDTVTDEETKLEHIFENYVSNGDATCQADGTKSATCQYGCRTMRKIADEGSKLEHVFENYVSNNDATCKADGTKTGSCKYGCGKTKKIADVGSKLSHVFKEYITDKEATCTADGTEIATCDRDGCNVTDTRAVAAKNHNYGAWEVIDEPTCTKGGLEKRVCANDPTHVEERPLGKRPHAYSEDWKSDTMNHWKECDCSDKTESGKHVWSDGQVKTPAGEYTEGVMLYTCTICMETKEESIVPLGHTHTLVRTPAKEATCTENGNFEYWYCSACEKYFSDAECSHTVNVADMVIPAMHTLTYTAAKGKTCTQDGNIEYWYCSACEKYFSDAECKFTVNVADIAIPAAHTLTYTAAKDKTCTQDGNVEYWYCSVCEKYFSDEGATTEIKLENIVIEAAHTALTTSVTEATCTEEGAKTTTCGDCDYENVETISALGHTFKLGVCERCPATNKLSIVTNPSVTSVYYGEQPIFTDGVVQNELGETVTGGTWSITYANYSVSGTAKEIATTVTLTFIPDGTEYDSISKEISLNLHAVAKYGKNYYATVDGALSAANKSNSGTVYALPLEYELDSGRAKIAKTIAVVTEIKLGVTLTLPYMEDKLDTTMSYVFVVGNSEYRTSAYGKTNFLKNQIYIAEEHTLYSAGTINVAGEVSGGDHQNYNGIGNANSVTAGWHAQINLGANAKLISTGTVNCYGFINEEDKDNGSEFIVEQGKATVMFTILDYRGAQRYFGMIDPTNSEVKQNITSAAFAGAFGGTGTYTPDTLQDAPFKRFYIESVTAKTTVKHGAQMVGCVVLLADSDNQQTTLNVINNSDAIIALTGSESSVTYKYDYTTHKTALDIYGDMTLNPLQLKILIKKSEYGTTVKIELTLTTGATGKSSGVFFPISDLFDISLNAINGSATVNALAQKVKLLPGAKLTIGTGVVVNASEIAVYENNDLFLNGGDKHYNPERDFAELIVSGTLNVQAIGGEVMIGDDGARLNISRATSVISKEVKTMTTNKNVEIKVGLLSAVLPYVQVDYSSDEESTLVATNTNGKLLRGSEFFVRNGKWVSEIVYVDLQLNGGTASMPNQLYDNGYVMNVNELPVPERTDHLFMGWYTTENFEDGTEFTTTFALMEDVTFYAKWVSNAIYVNMQLNGGTGSTLSGPYTYEYEITAGELPVPQRPDYNFMGWYTTKNFASGTEFTALTLTEDITVYAKWELKEGTIIVQFATTTAEDIEKTATFAMQTIGEAAKKATYPKEAIECNEDTSYARYVFGYYADSEYKVPFDFSQEITQDTTIYVRWEKKISVTISTGIKYASKLEVNGEAVNTIVRTTYVLPGAQVELIAASTNNQVNIEATYKQDGENVVINFTGTESATATLTVESNTTFRILPTKIS